MRCIVRLLLVLQVMSICIGASFGESAIAEDPLITIISPKNGEIVDSTFEITYELRSDIEVHDVHIFLDGDYQKEVISVLKNIPKGKHEIIIKASTDEQDGLVGWDSVDITVK